MAQIEQNNNLVPIFPKVFGEYKLHFDDNEEKILEKWKSFDHQVEHSLITSDRNHIFQAKPYETLEQRKKWKVWDDNFQILHLNKNILKNCHELRSIGRSILEIAYVFCRDAYGLSLNEQTYLDFCDSWMIKLTGSQDGGEFRVHNHAFSWLTGICYLDDSECGLSLRKDNFVSSFEDDNYPFVWDKEIKNKSFFTEDQVDINVEKGKVVIFNSRMTHGLNDSTTKPNDVRYSFAFNIWPYGIVNNVGGAQLEYHAPPPREDL